MTINEFIKYLQNMPEEDKNIEIGYIDFSTSLMESFEDLEIIKNEYKRGKLINIVY